MEINVAVMCRNASGEADILKFKFELKDSQYDLGEHYDMAFDKATSQGFEPVIAFDEHEPAWQALASNTPIESLADPLTDPNGISVEVIEQDEVNSPQESGSANVYERFFQEAVHVMQGTFLEGKFAGSESITNAGNLISRYLTKEIPEAGGDAKLYFAFGPDGYWNDEEGYVEAVVDATLSADPNHHNDIAKRHDGVVIVGMTLNEISEVGLLSFPEVSDLDEAAQSALERAQEYGFEVNEDNTVEVMREELALAINVEITLMPKNFDPVLYCSMEHMKRIQELESSPARETP
jgi:hypothetical protein